MKEPVYLFRFARFERVLHGMLMTSFLGLALTGIPLLFSNRRFAYVLARILGGFRVAGTLHRTFATLLLVTFTLHLYRILRRLLVDHEYRILWGRDSLVPQPRDLLEMLQHLRWFLGLGKRPRFGRYTYWEKFDYWAVFWGMGIIGTSGLLLWFPKTFSRVLPGWLFNIALLVHGEEALLAMVFIFTVHFFNGHIRPEKFPMDTVIFTGRIPLEEVRRERPAEYEALSEEDIERLAAPPASARLRILARIVGTVAVLVGLTVVLFTLYAFLF